MTENHTGNTLSAVLMTEVNRGLLHTGLDSVPGLQIVAICRSVDEFADVVLRLQPQLAIIDTTRGDGDGFAAIPRAFAEAPQIAVLIRTPNPSAHSVVAQAMKAGALGFITTASTSDEIGQAARSVVSGQPWLPANQSRQLLASVGHDGELTTAEREAKLKNFVIGLVPLIGGISAVMSLLWRRYLGQIGVRPVDLAIDPTSRIIDAGFALSVLVGLFGPLLFVRSWVELVDSDRAPRLSKWVSLHGRLARFLVSCVVLFAAGLIAAYAEIVVALFVGPFVAALIAARLFDLDDAFPAYLRQQGLKSKRTAASAVFITLAFLTVLSAEVLLVGPGFNNHGARGLFAPTVLGFSAQPMTQFTVDESRGPRSLLYIGGNADLYVFVDPCNDNEVEFVSVGSSRLVVIDEVVCP